MTQIPEDTPDDELTDSGAWAKHLGLAERPWHYRPRKLGEGANDE